MKVLYDISHMGPAAGTPEGRRGIFRACDSYIAAALRSPALDCHFAYASSYVAQLAGSAYAGPPGQAINGRLIRAWHNPFLPDPLSRGVVSFGRRAQPFLMKSPFAWKAASSLPKAVINRSAAAPENSERFDVYHSLYPALLERPAFGAAPRVLTVYDILPILFPDFYPEEKVFPHFRAIVRSVRREADWVICISEATKRDFCAYTGMDAARVFVAPLAADRTVFHRVPNDAESAAVRERHGIPNRPFILSLSAIEPRKNLAHLVRCFARVANHPAVREHVLVLVGQCAGRRNPLQDALRDYPEVRGRVVFTGHLPDADLAAVYGGAQVFVFPSVYEGFGLPPLEAMQCGVPVIASATSSLPEVVGDAGLLIDPANEDELCAALIRICDSEALRQDLAERALSQAARFSWETTVERTIEVYRRIARDR